MIEIAELSALNIVKFAVGWEQALFLDDKRQAWELKNDTPRDPFLLKYDQPVVDVVCGSFISFVLLE